MAGPLENAGPKVALITTGSTLSGIVQKNKDRHVARDVSRDSFACPTPRDVQSSYFVLLPGKIVLSRNFTAAMYGQ